MSDLEAIVFNLAANAMSSFARAGDLLGDRAVQVRTRVEEGRAALDFSDSGPGVVDVDVAHMWRPGVAGPGAESAGLGLTVIRDAVADMCGRTSVVEDGDLAADAYGELGARRSVSAFLCVSPASSPDLSSASAPSAVRFGAVWAPAVQIGSQLLGLRLAGGGHRG
ncbi:hypothetical protein SHKM778_04300 [Streptomyces sp. KM77-8]|uniref:Histidine kinase/HSP90-like ATPase domain-containing protein n=1 Tax=Streptomyces haneummycinicus TaxID=3074435 RepID=A0AAT9H9M3_9ACTN